ncbi:hypothetical protein Tco_1208373 [Tanacetum coccineum]
MDKLKIGRMEKRSYGLNGLKFTLFISCILSQPHLKPVFSMKGSREKRGAAPAVKLTVKWAPYVYDPIPTSVSHVGINNRSSRHSKKNSRNKQKSGKKSSRGSKGKDKKHEPKPKPGGIDLHVGNPGRF